MLKKNFTVKLTVYALTEHFDGGVSYIEDVYLNEADAHAARDRKRPKGRWFVDALQVLAPDDKNGEC